jgi:hypothetical protein
VAGLTDEPHVTETLAGQMITGLVTSLMVTVKLILTVPQVFAAETETVVTPLLNTDPLPVPEPEPVVAPLKV